ncbi:MAG: thiamine pyrophosphate-binding protein [Clostridiales Family XIII bacterium]|jgi:acetolactate synthase-1/2/3 large subunit|nr:thiamine pyrophosphate-binding protein [Clostridiales Family XIII bacterium]
MMVDGGRLFARQLKREGVDHIFTLCGGQIMPLIYGCREEGIEVIDVRHENAGVYAADAYARASGKPGVMLATVTPGVMQTMQGLFEARAAGSPVLVISASVGVDDFDTGAEQDMGMDTIAILRSNTLWSAKIFETERIPEYVAKAFRQMLGAAPGPVYLETPVNVMKARVESNAVLFPQKSRTFAQAFGDPALIDAAADMLLGAKRPVLAVGDAAVFTAEGGRAAVTALADRLGMPVYAATMARGLFGSEDDALFRIGEGALCEADVIVTLAAAMNFRLNNGKAPMINEKARFIQIHPDARMIGFNCPADIGIVAGAGAAARQLLEAVRARDARDSSASGDRRTWAKRALDLHAAYRAEWDAGYGFRNTLPMHPARLAAEVGKFLNEEAPDWSVAADGGDAYEWILRAVRAREPGQIVGYAANGTIGTGQGFAMGLWRARGKPVLEYTGDGSIGFHLGEFDTMARFGMRIICVVSNDAQWGMVKMAETMRNADAVQKGYIATTLAERRYEKIAEALGGHGEYVEDIKDVIPAIRRAYRSGKPSIVNVKVADGRPCPFTVAYGCGGRPLTREEIAAYYAKDATSVEK